MFDTLVWKTYLIKTYSSWRDTFPGILRIKHALLESDDLPNGIPSLNSWISCSRISCNSSWKSSMSLYDVLQERRLPMSKFNILNESCHFSLRFLWTYIINVISIDLFEPTCRETHPSYSSSHIRNIQVVFLILETVSLTAYKFA